MVAVATVAGSMSAIGQPRASARERPETIDEMFARGFVLGIGMSACPGFYEIKGLDLRNKRCTSSRLIRSCTTEERAFVFGQLLEQTSCRAGDNQGDVLTTVIRFAKVDWSR